MRIVSFEVKGSMGHFRRPDTTGAHLSYPVITRTVVQGMIASMLGLERLDGDAWVGIQICSGVRTRAQEMSMLGKGWIGGGGSFNRPTSVELVINPHYIIYYGGKYAAGLEEMLGRQHSHYHTYLGSAYCLTFPRYVGAWEGQEITPPYPDMMVSSTIVPSHAIQELDVTGGEKYGRVGGMHYQYLGERRFSGTINIIYDYGGKKITFRPKGEKEVAGHPYKFFPGKEQGEVICLW